MAIARLLWLVCGRFGNGTSKSGFCDRFQIVTDSRCKPIVIYPRELWRIILSTPQNFSPRNCIDFERAALRNGKPAS